jgi:hypothetical protein
MGEHLALGAGNICGQDYDCPVNSEICSTGRCNQGLCSYYIMGGDCANDRHCVDWQECVDCLCTDRK